MILSAKCQQRFYRQQGLLCWTGRRGSKPTKIPKSKTSSLALVEAVVLGDGHSEIKPTWWLSKKRMGRSPIVTRVWPDGGTW